MTKVEEGKRKVNMEGRVQCFHESGNDDFEVGQKLSGKQNLNEKGSSDTQEADGKFRTLLGFTIHTNSATTQQTLISPQNKKVGTSCAWQVYL